ncbi:MAG: dTDP-4-dehydrorhamnose 3,5-epimerase [Candidatus Margulisbacteria bacterium]|nr:dTDP-4-dehydrorhamnose 3,5-epimerase [Candidatus Margulisiibacteriota bacterium]
MKFINTSIPGVIEIEPHVFGDERGYFLETYRQDVFLKNGIEVEFVQDNFSYSKKGILRGIHLQAEPFAQDKLVRVAEGEVFDVAVDLRRDSRTFGEWVGVSLSESNKKMLFIPKGFGHGFCVVSDYAKFEYKCSAVYSPAHEFSVAWNDPQIAINWPIDEPFLSEKDKLAPFLSELVL